jgi:filamentous hemagglutinin family protein
MDQSITAANPMAAMKRLKLMRALLLMTTVLPGALASPLQANTLPTGGTVAAGSATVTTDGASTVVNQSSNRAVINWTDFSVAEGKRVVFRQPNATSAVLNRVTGTAMSNIAGQITSDGAVYLVNPNGIVISSTGAVSAAGGFVASTLGISDDDFMAGQARFVGNGASAKVHNAGNVTVGTGAFVALLGGSVSNSGYIAVPQGKIGLGSGEQIALDLNGDNFMQVAIPSSAISDGGALIDNSGQLTSSGGTIVLKAATLKDVVRNVINMSGSISADSAISDGGKILLLGGDGGTVKVTGSLTAKASGASGNGGLVETSGQRVDVNQATINTTAVNGQTGDWRIGAESFHVAASGGDITGAQLSANLANSNVKISSTGGSLGSDGDVLINDAVNWASGNSLNISAFGSVRVSRDIAASGANAELVLRADNTGTGIGTVSFEGGATAALSGADSSVRIYYNPVSFGTGESFASVSGGSVKAYQLVNTLDNLQAISSFSRDNNYALGRNIDASATAEWNGGAGFVPLFQDLETGQGFRGSFDGQGFVISNLTINRPSENNVGLFGRTDFSASLVNIGISGGRVAGKDYVGPLVAINFGNIENSYAATTVTGNTRVGGLVGNSTKNTITNSYATGSVIGHRYVGGLVGELPGGTIIRSHATGAVQGFDFLGGLVGQSGGWNASAPSISQSYATGSVSGLYLLGGLVGFTSDTSISQSYATGDVNGYMSAGGLVGWQSAQSGINTSMWNGPLPGNKVTESYATGNVQGFRTIGGLVGYSQSAIIVNSLSSGKVSGTQLIGGLIGEAVAGTSVQLSSSTSQVVGNTGPDGTDVGGLIGLLSDSTVSGSFATGAVTGNANVGGLVGWLVNSQLTETYASGAVNGNVRVGGLVGYYYFPRGITRSYASGNVTGRDRVGGLVGDSQFGSISQSYALGQVNAVGQNGGAGGLVGLMAGGAITESYSAGAVIGAIHAGGLIGFAEGVMITSSFWDTTTSGKSTMCGTGMGSSCNNANGLTTDQMQDFESYSSTYLGWDFENVWAPPTRSGQAGQTKGHYPELYALSPVVVAKPVSATRTYGAANPALTAAIISGGTSKYALGPSGDSLANVELFTSTATITSGVGSYQIRPKTDATSIKGVVYRVIMKDNGTLTVTPAPLIVTYTANPVLRAINQSNPLFTGTQSAIGLVNGDTLASVTSGTATYYTTHKAGFGTYAIYGQGLTGSSANYTYTFVQAPGNETALKIVPASGCKNQKGKSCQ